jgi:hypothetical protein
MRYDSDESETEQTTSAAETALGEALWLSSWVLR